MKRILTMLVLMPFMALATTLYVDGTIGSDENSGLSADVAKATIQAAIDASAGGDTILVAEGTYFENIIVDKNVTLKASQDFQVCVNGQARNHCIEITVDGNGFVIDGFVLTNGRAMADRYSGNTYGGGIACRATGTIKDCIFKNNGNDSQQFAGGLEIHGEAKDVVVENCLFVGNAVRCSGGGVLCEGSATFDHCTIWGNTCSSWNQIGGFAVASGGTATIKNSIIWNNSTAEIGIYSGGGSGTISINYSCVEGGCSGTGNISDDPMFVETESDFALQESSPCRAHGEDGCNMGFSKGSSVVLYVNGATGSDENDGLSSDSAKATIQAAIDAAKDGGTILVAPGTYTPIVTDDKPLTIVGAMGAEKTIIAGDATHRCVTAFPYGSEVIVHTNTTIVGFTLTNGSATDATDPEYGGGGAIKGGIAKYCILSNNVARGAGAANVCVLENCLVVGNTAQYNGGAGDDIITKGCTFAKNYARHNSGAPVHSALLNCVAYGNSSGCDFGGDGGQFYDWQGSEFGEALGYASGQRTNCYTTDPHFVDAANGDYRLAANSPCIDAGDNSYVVGDTDLDGNARIVNGVVDIGCYEYRTQDPLQDRLVAWYKFDGDAKDATTNRHDGVVHGATLTTDKNGDANGAYHFNGSSWISVDNSDALTAIHNTITVSAWVKLANTGMSCLFCKGTDYVLRQYGFVVHTSSSVDNYTITDGGTYGTQYANINLRSSSPVSVGMWQHVAMTYDGSTVVAYLDGRQVGSKSVVGYFPEVSGGLVIGKDPPGITEYLTGDLDDIRIYNRPLSAVEITSLYESEKPIMKIWSVTFDACGGVASRDTMTVTNRTAIGELPTAERIGHKFLGWFTEKNEGTQVTSETIITTNATFYAHWFDTSIGNVTGATNVLWRTGGEAVWNTEETDDGWDVRSGTIGKSSETWIECVVTNGCRVAFGWKSSCEPGEEGEMYDYLSFAIDDGPKAAICGETDWTNGVFTVAGAGEHILRWTYQKDYRTSEGEDCGWLGKVKVDPEVPVSFDGNGATSGEVPTIATAYFGDTVVIPGTGTLAKSCHTFGGWQFGGTTYSEGEPLKVETNAVELVAVWEAKVLDAVTLQTPETQRVITEKIGISFNMPDNATTIRYTLDGSEPTSASAVYIGPIEVADRSVTVKAIAYADDWFDSACATWNLTRAPWSAAECLNIEMRTFSYAGNADWVRDLDTTHDGEAAMRSGAIGDKQKSTIQMSVTGSGTVSFWCKVSSECDPDDGTVYDGLAVLVDGEEVYDDLIGGEVGWTNITIEVVGEGEHVIGWRYEKDKTGSAGEDCARLDEILWQADETVVTAAETGSKAIVIGREWIERDIVERYGAGKTEAFRRKYGTDYDLAVRQLSGKTVNGKSAVVWQDYVAGTDPTDTNSVLVSSIEMVNGVPVVTWKPDLKTERTYKIWGSTNLVNGSVWEWPTNALHRFFKVTVEMP